MFLLTDGRLGTDIAYLVGKQKYPVPTDTSEKARGLLKDRAMRGEKGVVEDAISISAETDIQ